MIYEHALYYDIAFGFRDVPKECDFLVGVGERFGIGASSFLELGCGPGFHVLEMAARGKRSAGLDLAPAMLQLLGDKATERGASIQTIEANMCGFQVDAPFDLAVLLMDSASHILTNEDMLSHLRSVSAALKPGGLYVLEMAHPSNHLGGRKTTGTDWTTERDGIKVHMVWGQEGDPFDPITEIATASTTLTVDDPDHGHLVIEDKVKSRSWTYQTLRALIEHSGLFEPVAFFGSLDAEILFDNQEAAWRMVPVLRRRGV